MSFAAASARPVFQSTPVIADGRTVGRLTKLREEHLMSADYKLVDAFIGQGPHIREGSPAQNAKVFKAPVLMFQGDIDKNVGVGEARYMKEKLTQADKSVEYIEFKGLDHYLDDSGARTRLLSRSDAFIRQALGLQEPSSASPAVSSRTPG